MGNKELLELTARLAGRILELEAEVEKSGREAQSWYELYREARRAIRGREDGKGERDDA